MDNPTEEKTYYGLRPFPDVNMDRRPYVLIKDRVSLSVVDLKNKKATIVVQNCPFRWDSSRDYNMDVSMTKDG